MKHFLNSFLGIVRRIFIYYSFISKSKSRCRNAIIILCTSTNKHNRKLSSLKKKEKINDNNLMIKKIYSFFLFFRYRIISKIKKYVQKFFKTYKRY